MLKSFLLCGSQLILVPDAPGPNPGMPCACAVAVVGEEALYPPLPQEL